MKDYDPEGERIYYNNQIYVIHRKTRTVYVQRRAKNTDTVWWQRLNPKGETARIVKDLASKKAMSRSSGI